MHKFGIMMAGGVKHELEHYDRYSDERLYRRRRRHTYLHANYLVGELFVTGMRMATLGIGGMMVFGGTMSFGEIGALLVLIGFLQQGVDNIDKVSQTFWKERGQIQALWDFMDKTPVVSNLHTGRELEYRGGDIVFEGGCFCL
jgi:ABC-type multidrug transport system fused ATPase/permease subunit